jgi:hypothetical protein
LWRRDWRGADHRLSALLKVKLEEEGFADDLKDFAKGESSKYKADRIRESATTGGSEARDVISRGDGEGSR